MLGLVQSVCQEWTAPATPIGFTSQPHHLWVFHTVTQSPAQPVFATRALCRAFWAECYRCIPYRAAMEEAGVALSQQAL